MSDRLSQLAAARFYGIVDLGYTRGRDVADLARQMIEGGVDIVQLRAKHATPDEVREMAERFVPAVRESGGLSIINDHPQIAAECGADGAHVGQDDLGVAQTRAMLQPGQLVGKSTHSLDQARAACSEGPDYIGVGPLYATPTKPDYVPVGLPLVRQVAEALPDDFPQFCIGGVKLERLDEVLAAGARRVVIVSGILDAPDMVGYCREVRRRLDGC